MSTLCRSTWIRRWCWNGLNLDINEIQSQMWPPTQELKIRHKQLQRNTSTESAVQKTMYAEIVKVKKRLREVEQKNYIVGKLSQGSDLFSGGKKVKWMFSAGGWTRTTETYEGWMAKDHESRSGRQKDVWHRFSKLRRTCCTSGDCIWTVPWWVKPIFCLD